MAHSLSSFFTPETAEKAGYIETAFVKNEGAETLRFPDIPNFAKISADTQVTGLEYDSRKVQPGNLYFALPGLHADGHAFIPDAVKRGAAVIVHQDELGEWFPGVVYIRVTDSRFAMSPIADAYYDHPSRNLTVIGVTGTEGKSTTVYLIWQLLRLLGKKAGFISTVQYSCGGEEQWNPEHQTTPEAVAIHKRLAEMRDNGAEYAVLESSSHGLSPRTNRLGDAAFDAAVMTNVTHEHLEFHGTWEQYRCDKANLFRALDRFSHEKPDPVPSFGVVNLDDPSAAYFAAATQQKTYTFSTKGAEADLSLQSITSTAGGNQYRVLVRGDRTAKDSITIDITDNLPGAFNAGNVLAALLVTATLLGRPAAELAPLVTRLKPVRGRMTVVDKGQPFEVLVDYAHTPSSFSTIFPPLRERLDKTGGRIISLFGSPGERDTAKRSEQGRIAARWCDIVILTDEDPRGEEPMAILKEIERGCREIKPEGSFFLIPDRPTAIRKAFSLAQPGDLVLLLGKGHENSIIYAKGAVNFDEFAEAEKALAEMGYR
jgi:UDP-N-acetylmuramoyl-L-alanyl-D-glutamate--2,6-diaminopimelate ligase